MVNLPRNRNKERWAAYAGLFLTFFHSPRFSRLLHLIQRTLNIGDHFFHLPGIGFAEPLRYTMSASLSLKSCDTKDLLTSVRSGQPLNKWIIQAWPQLFREYLNCLRNFRTTSFWFLTSGCSMVFQRKNNTFSLNWSSVGMIPVQLSFVPSSRRKTGTHVLAEAFMPMQWWIELFTMQRGCLQAT